MMMLRETRRRAKVLVGPFLGMALTGYFAYHIVAGDRGLVAWVHLTKQLHVAKGNLSKIESRRAELAHRVSQMRSKHIDPDLLDTQVRKTLDVVRPDEVVIMTPPAKP